MYGSHDYLNQSIFLLWRKRERGIKSIIDQLAAGSELVRDKNI